jgi:hypothetical protein
MLWIIKMLWYRYVLRRYRPIDERTANVRFLVELGDHTASNTIETLERHFRETSPFGIRLGSRVVVIGQCQTIASLAFALAKEFDRVRRSARHAAPEFLLPFSRIVDATHKVHGTILAILRRAEDANLTNEEFDQTTAELELCRMDLVALYVESCKLYHALTAAVLADDVLRAHVANPYLHKRPGLAIIQIRSRGSDHPDFNRGIVLSTPLDLIVLSSFCSLCVGLVTWVQVHSYHPTAIDLILLAWGLPAVSFIVVGTARAIRSWFSTMSWVERTFLRQ